MSKYSSLCASYQDDLAAAAPVLNAVSATHGVPVADIVGKCRRSNIVHARRAAIVALDKAFGWSLPRLARIFDCNHTTILHHLDVVSGRRWDKHDRKREVALAWRRAHREQRRRA